MKQISFIGLLLLSLNCLSQNLNGKFCDLNDGYGSTCITFESNKFVYESSGCFGFFYGVGTSIEINDTLKLNFKDPNNKGNRWELIEKSTTNDDSLTFYIQCLDITEDILPYTDIKLYDTIPSDKVNPIYHFETNITGSLKFKIPSDVRLKYLIGHFLGTRPFKTKIETGFDYKFIGVVNRSDTTFETKGGLEYLYDLKNKDTLFLDRLDWSDNKPIKYYRIKN